MTLATTDRSFDLSTADGCIQQIVSGYVKVQQGYGIADEAISAYLNLPGKTARTLWEDLQAAGCEMSLKTIQNRQSKLRQAGELSPATKGRRSDIKAKDDEGSRLAAELFHLGELLQSNGTAMQNCIKPEQLKTATDEEIDHLISTVLENNAATLKVKRWHEENLDKVVEAGLMKASDAYKTIRDLDEVNSFLRETFSPVFEGLDDD